MGLGYVGLPVSLAFYTAGFQVRGHDINAERVDALKASRLPFADSEPGLTELMESVKPSDRFRVDTSPDVLADADVLFLAIDTPVDTGYRLDRDRFERGLEAIARSMRAGALVVVESTIPPGTIDRLVVPYLERRTGLRAGESFFVLHCPERLRPGRLLQNLHNLPRLVGGDTELTSALGIALYRNVVFASLQPVHYRTAEVVKTAENTARDVQIALANQLAVVCDHAGVDIRDVRAAVNEIWGREPLILEPGPGVGGHCLPKDPWLMVDGLSNDQARALVAGAREMNSYMPAHVVALGERLLLEEGLAPGHARVVLLGVAYNAGSDDTRNSPALAVADLLRPRVNELRLHDPYVRPHGGPLLDVLDGADIAILLVAHEAYRHLDLAAIRQRMAHPVLLDTRRALDGHTCRAAGFRYAALGVSALAPNDS